MLANAVAVVVGAVADGGTRARAFLGGGLKATGGKGKDVFLDLDGTSGGRPADLLFRRRGRGIVEGEVEDVGGSRSVTGRDGRGRCGRGGGGSDRLGLARGERHLSLVVHLALGANGTDGSATTRKF